MLFEQKGLRFVGFLALLSFLAIITISQTKTSLELEDAEQSYYTQSWRLGYDDQPPLYTWLQKPINDFLGLSKFSLSFLRGVLYASTLVVLFLLGKKILKNKQKAELVVLSTALIPVFADFAFRRLSHTLLLCFAIVLSCLALAYLMDKKSIRNYVFLGICFGIGMLSKYNYVLFAAAVSIMVVFNKNLRNIVLDLKFIVSVTIGLLLFLPHLYWIFSGDHIYQIQESVAFKMEDKASGIIVLTPILNTFLAFVQSTSLLILATLLLLWLKKVKWRVHKDSKWFLQLFVVQMLTMTIFFVAADVKNVEARWLLPLLLPYLVLWIDSIPEKYGKFKRWGGFVFIFFVIIQVVRTPTEKMLGIKSDNQFDYTPLSNKLREQYPNDVWILPNVTYGGQLRLLNQKKTMLTLDDFSIPESLMVPEHGVVLATSKDLFASKEPLDSLVQYGPDKDDIFFYKIDDITKIPAWELSVFQ